MTLGDVSLFQVSFCCSDYSASNFCLEKHRIFTSRASEGSFFCPINISVKLDRSHKILVDKNLYLLIRPWHLSSYKAIHLKVSYSLNTLLVVFSFYTQLIKLCLTYNILVWGENTPNSTEKMFTC